MKRITHKVKWDALEKYCTENQESLPDSIPNNIRDWTRFKIMYNIYMMSYNQRIKNKKSLKSDMLFFVDDETWVDKIIHSKKNRFDLLRFVIIALGYKNSVLEVSAHLTKSNFYNQVKVKNSKSVPGQWAIVSANIIMRNSHTELGARMYRKFGLNLLKLSNKKLIKIRTSKSKIWTNSIGGK